MCRKDVVFTKKTYLRRDCIVIETQRNETNLATNYQQNYQSN